MIVGGYTLDLYCDTGNPAHDLRENYEHDKASYGGIDQSHAVKQARRDGWTINWHERTTRCPLCRNYKPKVTAQPAPSAAQDGEVSDATQG